MDSYSPYAFLFNPTKKGFPKHQTDSGASQRAAEVLSLDLAPTQLLLRRMDLLPLRRPGIRECKSCLLPQALCCLVAPSHPLFLKAFWPFSVSWRCPFNQLVKLSGDLMGSEASKAKAKQSVTFYTRANALNWNFPVGTFKVGWLHNMSWLFF